MSDDVTKRPETVHFRPTRLHVSPSEPAAIDWIIQDIYVGNVSVIPRRFTWLWWRIGARRAWRRLTWFWPRKPPIRRLI